VAADNKGPSIWDEYLDNKSLAGPGMSGAIAINLYDREQYPKDIALMKAMGLTSYRFCHRQVRFSARPVAQAGVDDASRIA